MLSSRLPWTRGLVLAGALTLVATMPARAVEPDFLTFESGPVRPLALSPDGARLFACNIPDGQLEVFAVGAEGLTHLGSVPVGLEPVAVAARSNDEVWVVNHLSDSISVLDVPSRRVVRTLLVGDEPRDLVFAGPGKNRAFVTTAHRGQHRTDPSLAGVPGAGDPQLTTPGVPRADVWVFDADDPGPGHRRYAAAHRRTVQRHAARARGEPGRHEGLCRRLPLRQPQHCDQRGWGVRRLRCDDAMRAGWDDGSGRRRAAGD